MLKGQGSLLSIYRAPTVCPAALNSGDTVTNKVEHGAFMELVHQGGSLTKVIQAGVCLPEHGSRATAWTGGASPTG